MKYLFIILSMVFWGSVSAQDTTISKTDLIGAAKLFDLQFTYKEIDTLYSDVIDNIANYKAMHQLSLPNSVPLSTWQIAVPQNKNKKAGVVNFPLTKVELPTHKEDLAFYSISELAYLIKNKKDLY